MGSQNASEEAGTKKQPVMRTLRVADAALLRALGTHFRSSARVNEVGKLRPKRSDDASRTIDDRQACRGHRPSWPQARRRHRGADVDHRMAPPHDARRSDGITQARLCDRTIALGAGRLGLPDRDERDAGSGGLRR
jgi:hypothetical protein